MGERQDCVGSTSQRESLYAQLAPLVRRMIHQYGHDADMRQDLIGEIYCRFCSLFDAYDPSCGVPLRPYLIRKLTATIYTYARQQWRTQRRELQWDDDRREIGTGGSHADRSLDPTHKWIEALSEQIEATLPAAMAQLSERQRQVVIWRYYEERTFEEMAGILAVQPSTARSLLRHGLNRLRSLLTAESATSNSCG